MKTFILIRLPFFSITLLERNLFADVPQSNQESEGRFLFKVNGKNRKERIPMGKHLFKVSNEDTGTTSSGIVIVSLLLPFSRYFPMEYHRELVWSWQRVKAAFIVHNPAVNCMFKVNSRNTRTRKTSVSIVNFE